MLIGKTDSMYTMQFVANDPNVMRIRQLWSTGGVVGRNCMVEFEGVVFFLSGNDVFATDGSEVRSIANNLVRKAIFDNLAEDPQASWLAVNPGLRELWVAPMTISSSLYPNVIYTYDLDNGHWGQRLVYKTTGTGTSEIADAAYGVSSASNQDKWNSEAVLQWNSEAEKAWNDGVATGQEKLMIWAHPRADGPAADGHLMQSDVTVDTRTASARRDGIQISEDEDAVYTVRRAWLDTVQTDALQVQIGSRYNDASAYKYAPAFTYEPDAESVPTMVKGREFSVIVSAENADQWAVPRISLEVAEARGRF
jgi:hypothetical protein